MPFLDRTPTCCESRACRSGRRWWCSLHHATLFSFLLAASLCDWDQKAIPLSLTTTGTVIGLIMRHLLPVAVAESTRPS